MILRTATIVLMLAFALRADLLPVGQQVDLKFTATDGREINLKDYRGKVVALYFCASWCPPCVREFPKVHTAYERLKPFGFEVIGLTYERTRKQFDLYTKNKRISWPQYYEDEAWESALLKPFKITGIPHIILLDQNGHVVVPNARGKLEEHARTLLKLPPLNQQWGQWRGPSATGYAPQANPPTEWSENKNLLWKTPIPGLGHSSPIVWGDHVYLTTAVPLGDQLPVPEQPPGAHNNLDPTHRLQFQVHAYHRGTGKPVWQTTVHSAQPHESTHESATWASQSPVVDDQHLIASFGSAGVFGLAPQTGKLIWKRDLGKMKVKHGHGEGASPVMHLNTVVINWDHEGDSFIIALDKRTGKTRWRQARDEPTSWSTPIIVQYGQTTQLIVSATRAIRSYDLTNGNEIWRATGLPNNVVASPVFSKGVVYAGASYEKRTMLAIKINGAQGDLTGTDKILWTRRVATPYVPSPLLMHDETLYFFHHYQGFLSKLEGRTGRDQGPFRLGGLGNFYASPVAAKNLVYLTDRRGQTLVFNHGADPKPLARNQLNDAFSASPAIAGNAIFLRGEKFLYCLAEGDD